MSTTEQMALGLDVPEARDVRAGRVVPGDRVQIRDHTGAALRVVEVVAARTYWRRCTYAWPVGLTYYRLSTRLDVQPKTWDGLHHRLHPATTVEVIDRPSAPERLAARRRRVTRGAYDRPRRQITDHDRDQAHDTPGAADPTERPR